MKVSSIIDHTLLKADAREEDLVNLIEEAKKYKFYSVCVNPDNVRLAKELLKGTDVKVATVVGFPLGSNTSKVKAFEAKNAIENGADEVDMVINISYLKDKKYSEVRKDIEGVVKEVDGKIVKVIIETCLLTDEEKIKACQLSREAGADFVKTSTGFSSGGASVEDVKLMKETVGEELKVKASGGIRDLATAKLMIQAGADRLGVSASVAIAEEDK